jgi:DMSO/TMAO reductase YedYZ molybdopterin-dependent catalytic subunit
VFGLVEDPLRLSWEEFSNLLQSEVLADMHCVTRWSRFDNHAARPHACACPLSNIQG